MCVSLQNNFPLNPQHHTQFPRKRLTEAVQKELSPKTPSLCRLESLILHSFSDLTDPRLDRKKRHLLQDIVAIAICAFLSGADDWVGVVEFGKAKNDWLTSFLTLPNGIPSHDTFGRVFSLLNPDEFEACFAHWVSLTRLQTTGEIMAIDGKTLRGSHDQRHGQSPIHMVSAWASSNRVVLGQLKTEAKSNEITAIPQLLQSLDLSGCIVTTDAMGCQKAIAALIIEKNADYVLALKENHGLLFKEVTDFFDQAQANKFQVSGIQHCQILEKNHGRLEIRRYWVTNEVSHFQQSAGWKNFRLIGMVEAERTIRGKTSIERRYFIGSIERNVMIFAKAVRGHWGIENSVHWILDVCFREDQSRVRKGHPPENIAVLRHIALNLIGKNPKRKGIKNERLKAGWNTDHLIDILWGNRNNRIANVSK